MAVRPATRPLEVWGGVEATVNRVGDRYFDQLARSGHIDRPDDLVRFAALGIHALRYPILWERTAPLGPANADWRWTDERLRQLRELGIPPIAGLVHHGSGPPDTSLLDPRFPERLAAFAGAVARRYPWIEAYTPVNEPLTTARFSALYGHWYPHERSDLAFARALLNQCRAVVLAMSAIRQVNPEARLIQTEDLGKVYSCPTLAYQAEFENERRWLTFDLLSGNLTADRPMWHWLRWLGIPVEDLDWFGEHPCPPDIMGVNIYLTSERYLDDRVDHFPGEAIGTNGKHQYVDLAAARVLSQGIAGAEGLLRDAWDRYRLPLAITETHNGSSREEQLRWLNEVWNAANAARGAGVDIRAMTVWALLGSYDWPSLVTRSDGHYEPGAFDLRGPRPRATAIAQMTRDLAERGSHDHPALDVPGWWRRPDRFIHRRPDVPDRPSPQHQPTQRAVLLLGGTTGLAQALAAACARRHLPCSLVPRTVVHGLDRISEQVRPWIVIDTGEEMPCSRNATDPIALMRPIMRDPMDLARSCADAGLPLVLFASELVFGGIVGPHTESSCRSPSDDVGRQQAAIEDEVLSLAPGTLIVRSGPLFGFEDAADEFTSIERPEEERMSPSYLPDVADAVLDLLLDRERGIWHVANAGDATTSEFQRIAAELLGARPQSVLTTAPVRSRALASERGWLLPPWRDALERFIMHR